MGTWLDKIPSGVYGMSSAPARTEVFAFININGEVDDKETVGRGGTPISENASVPPTNTLSM